MPDFHCGRIREPSAGSRILSRRTHGYSLIEVLFVASLAALIAAMAIPQTLTSLDRSRTMAAGRLLTSRMMLARTQAIARGSTVALQFERSVRGIAFAVVADGNRNGVRTRDIQSGVDVIIEPSVLLPDLFPGVAIAANPGIAADPLQLGGSDLLSFTANGTSSSGSIYVRGRDGTQCVIRVLGATGRARLLRYDESVRDWVESY